MPSQPSAADSSVIAAEPPPFDPDRARPRAVVYVHLSAEALSAGRGVARVEEVGPVLLGRLRIVLGDRCSISLKPVIDLPAGHIPVDSYEIPARLREQLQLRYPADVFPYAAAVCRRIDVDHTIAYLSPDKGGPPGPDQDRQPRTARTPPPQLQNARRLASPAARTRHLAVAITPPPHLPRQRQRNPSPR